MSIIYDPVTGHPSRVFRPLAQKVETFISGRNLSNFKVGITSAPYNRFSNSYSTGYDAMLVVYETTSLVYVRQMEKFVIDYARARKTYKIDNERRGGAGNYTNPPYCLYTALKFR